MSVIQDLKTEIANGKLKFDSDKQRKELLGESTGTNATEKLQKLALSLAQTTSTFVRVSSVVRAEGHHGSGRALDVGNQDIALELLSQIANDVTVATWNIDELIFDAGVAGKTNRNEWNYDRGLKHDFNGTTLDGHKNHIHFAVTS